MRSAAEIGMLWPRCKSCGHIAQSHSTGETICGEMVRALCPTCGTWQKISCQCLIYNGPTWDEFVKTFNLTPEEIERYFPKDVRMGSNVYLIREKETEKLFSIWTSREMASAALLYYQARGVKCHVIEWQVNVSFEQPA